MMSSRLKLFAFWMVFCTASSAPANGQPAITPHQAMIFYKAHLESIGTISFKSSSQDRVAEESEQFTNRVTQEWRLDLSGERCYFRTDSTRGSEFYSEFLVSPQDFQNVTVKKKSLTVVGFTSYLKRPKDFFTLSLPLGYVSLPFGYFRDGRSNVFVVDLLVNPRMETSAQDEVVLCSEDAEYSIRVHLDSSKKWMASQIEYVRKRPVEPGRNVEKIIYRVLSSIDLGEAFVPQRYECQVSTAAAKFERPSNIRNLNGKLVLTESGEGTNVEENPARTFVAEIELSDIALTKHDGTDFAIQGTIPDGLPVSMQDALHLNFEWQGGKIVAKTPEASKALREARFVGGNRIRFWIITCVGTGLLIFGIVFAWRRRAS